MCFLCFRASMLSIPSECVIPLWRPGSWAQRECPRGVLDSQRLLQLCGLGQVLAVMHFICQVEWLFQMMVGIWSSSTFWWTVMGSELHTRNLKNATQLLGAIFSLSRKNSWNLWPWRQLQGAINTQTHTHTCTRVHTHTYMHTHIYIDINGKKKDAAFNCVTKECRYSHFYFKYIITSMEISSLFLNLITR